MRSDETVYDLAERVAHHIERHAEQYNQGLFVCRPSASYYKGYADMYPEPPCGTFACRAGWFVLLHDGNGQDNGVPYDAIEHRANQIIGLGYATAGLFSGAAVGRETRKQLKVGTPEYAAAGAKGVRDFMAIHEVHLKSRKLSDIPPPDYRTGDPNAETA